MTPAAEWNECPIPDELHMALAIMKNGRMKLVFKLGEKARRKDGSNKWVDDDLKSVSFYKGPVLIFDTKTPPGRRLQECVDEDTEQNSYTHWLPVPAPPGGWEDGPFILNGEIRQCRLAKDRRWEKMKRPY